MKQLLLLFYFLAIFESLKAQEQTTLECAMERMNVSLNLPPFLSPSQNYVFKGNLESIYVTKITEESPVPRLAQVYLYEPSYG